MKKVIFSKVLLFAILISNTLAVEVEYFINKNNCSQIIDKQAFKICYDYTLKGAKYVSYTLYGSLVNKVNIKKRNKFYTEKNIPKKYRSYTRDYTRTGWDRGHLANDASFDYDKKILRKTYSMANIIPQAPKVNRYTWIKAEKLARKVAVKFGQVNVISGVLYKNNPERIGKSKVAIPYAFWKMIYNYDYDYKKCFYYKNDKSINTKGDKLKSHLINCDELK